MQITRRNFLKASGVATGFMLLSGCTARLQQPVWMESYVQPPEQTLPGEDIWYASTCRMCPAGCGIVTRVSNGRARKIEGNPEHPLNRGKLCARGQAGLQELYHPDRVQQIMKRTGERGQGAWGTTGWEQILDEIAGLVQNVDPSRVAILTGVLPDYQAALVGRFLDGLDAPPAVVYDAQSAFDGRVVLAAANQEFFGVAALPVFDIAHADIVFGFGANFLETWLSPVAYGQAYGAMRSQLTTRGLLMAFEPRLSMTAASADRWVPTAPGSEGLIALALGKIIADEELGRTELDAAYATLYAEVDVAAIADTTAISAEELRRYAHMFAAGNHPVALPGGLLTGHDNGLDALKAVLALNVIAGRAGETGGMFLTPQAPSRDLRPTPINAFADVQALVARMAAGELDMLFVLGVNPLYALPAELGFHDALAGVKQIITFATQLDETAAQSDIVLPAHTYLETWGYQFVNPGGEQLMVSAQQPVVRPLYESRDPADVWLALADKIGDKVARRLPWPNLVNFIQTRLTSLQLQTGNIAAQDNDTFWTSWLQHGGWWSQDAAWATPEPSEDFLTPLHVNLPHFAGDANAYPFHLLPMPSMSFGDGRHAGLPWLQEAPDPMTTGSWDTWVEINPATAQQLGVQNSDVVEIASPAGAITAIVYTYPGIRPDVVAVPVGQGHSKLGRWAANRGSNVLQILAPQTEATSGQWAWAATRVQITKTDTRRILPVVENNLGVERFRQKGLEA